MKVISSVGPVEVEAEEIAPGLFITPFIDGGKAVAGWTVTGGAGYCLPHMPLCRNRARKLARDLAKLGDWSGNPGKRSDLMLAGIDVEQVKVLCRKAEAEPFCE